MPARDRIDMARTHSKRLGVPLCLDHGLFHHHRYHRHHRACNPSRSSSRNPHRSRSLQHIVPHHRACHRARHLIRAALVLICLAALHALDLPLT